MSSRLTTKKPLRDGAGYVEADTSVEPAPLPLADGELDGLDALEVHSIAHLIERKRQAGALDHWKLGVSKLPGTDTQTLIVKVSTTSDPLTLWAIHVALDKRNIAPCLRWPANRSDPQMEFVSWLADLLWLAKRNPLHCAKFRGWQQLFTLPPGSGAWLEVAYRVFKAMYVRQNLSSYTTRGLSLDDAQRQVLMMLPTSRMHAARLELQPAVFEQIRAHLLTSAMESPDKAGVHTPAAVAARRERLWRVHVLSGKQPAETARNWVALSEEDISRQAIGRQIQTIEAILKAR